MVEAYRKSAYLNCALATESAAATTDEKNTQPRDAHEGNAIVTTQTSLAKLSLNKVDEHARRSESNSWNRSMLANLVRSDRDWRMRAVAVGSMRDPDVLAEVVTGDRDWRVRSAAVERLTDQRLIVNVALGDANHLVRAMAVKRVADESVLTKVALNDTDEDVRRAAVERVRDQKLLRQIARRAPGRSTRQAASKRVNGTLAKSWLWLCML